MNWTKKLLIVFGVGWFIECVRNEYLKEIEERVLEHIRKLESFEEYGTIITKKK